MVPTRDIEDLRADVARRVHRLRRRRAVLGAAPVALVAVVLLGSVVLGGGDGSNVDTVGEGERHPTTVTAPDAQRETRPGGSNEPGGDSTIDSELRLPGGSPESKGGAAGGGVPESGPRIAFVSDRGGSKEVYVARADGSGARRITAGKGDPAHPALSPDGTFVAYTLMQGATGRSSIRIVRVDGTGNRALATPPGNSAYPTWSPDGRRLAFSHVGGDDRIASVWTIGADGHGARRLTSDDTASIDPAWSPDGQRIAFMRVVPGEGSAGRASVHLWVMDPSGADQRRVSDRQLTSPSWSPDGTRLAARALGAGRGGLAIVDVRSGAVRLLTSGPTWDSAPAWAPDGSAIFFDRDPDGHEEPACVAGGTVGLDTSQSTVSPVLECLPYTNGPRPAALWRYDLGAGRSVELAHQTGSSYDLTIVVG